MVNIAHITKSLGNDLNAEAGLKTALFSVRWMRK